MKKRPADLSELYVLGAKPQGDRQGGAAIVLDDVAHIAVRALGVDVAVIVVDGIIPGWKVRNMGVASASGHDGAIESGPSDLAALVHPVSAENAGFAFYAATPVRDSTGLRVGTLAILAREPRRFSEEDLVTFRKIATIIGCGR